MPIPELEEFIRQNKHLPNIPSVKEVEEKGLSLGDMQRRMMEKVEEQALYIIDLKNEILFLKEQNQKLFAAVDKLIQTKKP